MITVLFRRSEDGLIEGMSIRGHAGYADSGTDIVCASASTLLYTAINSLEEHCGMIGFYRLDEGNGKKPVPAAEIRIPKDELQKGPDRASQWIMSTIRTGFLLLEQTDRDEYGGNHIKVKHQG